MFRDEFMNVCNGAKGKLNLLTSNPLGYFISAVVAGFFIAFGGFVTFTIGGNLTAAGETMTKAVMAFSFASALSLVVMAGAELFTGNNFVMASAAFGGEAVGYLLHRESGGFSSGGGNVPFYRYP